MINDDYKFVFKGGQMFGPEEAASLSKAIEEIQKNAVGIEYVKEIPTKVPFGKLSVVKATGATTENVERMVYYQSGDGEVNYLSSTFSAPSTLVVSNRTDDPTTPYTGQIWFRTDL